MDLCDSLIQSKSAVEIYSRIYMFLWERKNELLYIFFPICCFVPSYYNFGVKFLILFFHDRIKSINYLWREFCFYFNFSLFSDCLIDIIKKVIHISFLAASFQLKWNFNLLMFSLILSKLYFVAINGTSFVDIYLLLTSANNCPLFQEIVY